MSKTKISLSDHFSYKKLLKFALPSIIMMVFSSIYGVVDGLFVSNFTDEVQFAAINMLMPIFMIVGAFGFMMGAGGTAIVAKTLGEKENGKANQYFTLFAIVVFVFGTVAATLSVIFIHPLSVLLGAEGALLDACVDYGRIVGMAMPCFMMQNLFQTFFVVAEKPKIGLLITVFAGITNMALDAILVTLLPFDLKLEGAAIATSVSQAVGGFVPIFYFLRKNTSLLRFCKTKFHGKALLRAMSNGSSELMSNISSSVITLLYNMQLLKFAQEKGVAAYGTIMYVGFIFVAIFIGYAVGTAPIVGYHYGAKNTPELKSILKKSATICLLGGIVMTLIAFFFARPLSMIFVSYDTELLNMTVHGFKIFSFSFLFSGICIYGSSFFTALNNGLVSAILAFARTLVFQMGLILVLPIFFHLEGVWFSAMLAEALAFITTAIAFMINRKKYGYF